MCEANAYIVKDGQEELPMESVDAIESGEGFCSKEQCERKKNANCKGKNIMTEIVLKPVGLIRSDIKEPVPRSDKEGIALKEKMKHVKAERDEIRTMISEIVIDPALEEALEGIEEYSHIQVLFWAHKVPEESRKLTKVHPMGLKEMPKKGIFATCSPARPNPVLLTAVKLVERNGNVLRVQGLEAIDGTPVIDIKPYVKGYHCAENPKSPEWMEKIHAMLEEAD